VCPASTASLVLPTPANLAIAESTALQYQTVMDAAADDARSLGGFLAGHGVPDSFDGWAGGWGEGPNVWPVTSPKPA